MPEDDQQGYPPALRVGAALGLVVLGLLGFILADVLTGGRLTGRGCADCGDNGGA